MSFFTSRRKSSEEELEPSPGKVMPPPPAAPQALGFETIIGTGCEIEGVLKSAGNIRIDGVFSGTLEITGNILVGDAARINADINARNLSIAGAVRGNVSGKRVQLLRSARIWGDISATALTTEEGAFIDGKISMTSPEVVQTEAEVREEAIEEVEAELVEEEVEAEVETELDTEIVAEEEPAAEAEAQPETEDEDTDEK